ncbi:MAG: hypothetical protein GY708_29170 [Actinomycetia bacterium]|nr:hypothetical protein [Actinomycetes bacterium]
MNGLRICTLVLEYNYGESKTSLGSVWLFHGDGSFDLESSSQPLSTIPGWTRVTGPIDYEVAAGIQSSLKEFLERCGVKVIEDAIAD